MAKFAQVTYGTHGDTAEYTYLVDNSVKAGTMIQPSVKHYKSGRIFGTTGIVQKVADQGSAQGMKIKEELKEKAADTDSKVDVVHAFTGKEAGISRFAGQGGRGTLRGSYSQYGGVGKPIKQADGAYASQGEDFQANPYIKKVRDANVASREIEEKYETFDSYSAPYMNKGDR